MGADGAQLRHIPGRVFNADDIGVFSQVQHGGCIHIDARVSRHVVKNQGNGGGIGNFFKVMDDAGHSLSFKIRRRKQQAGFASCIRNGFDAGDGFTRGRVVDSGHDVGFPLHFFFAYLSQLDSFFKFYEGQFSIGTADNQTIQPCVFPFCKILLKRFVMNIPVFQKRGADGCVNTFQLHVFFPPKYVCSLYNKNGLARELIGITISQRG